MPQPGSHAYDKRRARSRAEFEDQGLNDQDANVRANDALQERIPREAAEPRSSREAGTGHAGRGRGSG